MKRIIYFILAIVLSFAGCKKSLDEKVYGTLSSLSTASDINAAAAGIYSGIPFNLAVPNAMYPMAEVGSRYSSYGSNNELLGNLDFYRYQFSDRNVEFNAVWGALYTVVDRANEVIEAAQANIADTTVANPLIAEAKCMRGWAYFTLTQFWGPVPLQLKATSSSSDLTNAYLPRSPIADVYAQIVSDLKYASATFPNGSTRLPLIRPTSDLGRVTAASALAILGKVYLTMAGNPLNDPNGYANAAQTFATLVNQRSKYNTNLLPKGSYARIFAQTNEMNPEVLLAFRAFANNVTIANGNQFPAILAPIASNIDYDSFVTPPQYGLRFDITRLFEKNDVRLREGIGYIYADWRASALNAITGYRDSIQYDTVAMRYVKYSTKATQTPNSGYGIGFTKWRAETPRVGTSVRAYNNDWIIVRFADVLLSYAEALNELGQPSAAIPFLNEVRARAGASAIPLSTTQLNLRPIIRAERTRELIGEFTTVFDMRRWGTVKAEMDAYNITQFLNPGSAVLPVYNVKFNLYPVPYNQIALNPNLLPQNPGW